MKPASCGDEVRKNPHQRGTGMVRPGGSLSPTQARDHDTVAMVTVAEMGSSGHV